MSLAWPAAAPLLLLAPLVALGLWALDRVRARRLSRAVGPRSLELAEDFSRGERCLGRALVSTGFFLAAVAVMQPLWGEGGRRIAQSGIDIVVCLDVSRSMLARDVRPNRLERARREIRDLSQRVRGDRLGLVVFAGEADLVVPLTHDLESFAELALLAGPESVVRGGTDIGTALEAALEVLQDGTGVVLLITDGEDHAKRARAAAEICEERKITVHCAGIGSMPGSKIVVEEKGGEAFLRDRSGEEIVSALDSTSLREIAEMTGGVFVDTGAAPRPLVELYEERIEGLSRTSFEAEERNGRENRFQGPLLAALAAWILELCLTARKRS